MSLPTMSPPDRHPQKNNTNNKAMRTHRTYTTIPPLIFLLSIVSAVSGGVLLVIAFVLLRAVIPSMQVGAMLGYGIIAGGVGLTLVCAAWSIVAQRRSGGAAILCILIGGGLIWLLYPIWHHALILGRPDAIQIANYDQTQIVILAIYFFVIVLSLTVYRHLIRRRRDDYYSRPYVARYSHPHAWGQTIRSHIRACLRWQTVVVFLTPYLLLIIGSVVVYTIPLIAQTLGGDAPTDLRLAAQTALHTPHALSLDNLLSWEAISSMLLMSVIALIVLTQFYNYLIISDRPSSTHQTIRNQLFTTRRPIPWILGLLICGGRGAGDWYCHTIYSKPLPLHIAVPAGYFDRTPLVGSGEENGYSHISFIDTDYINKTTNTPTSIANGYIPDIAGYHYLFATGDNHIFGTGKVDVQARIDLLMSSGHIIDTDTTTIRGGPDYNLTGALIIHKRVFSRFALTTKKYTFDSYIPTFDASSLTGNKDNEDIDTIMPLPHSLQHKHNIQARYRISLSAAALHCYRGDEQTCLGIIQTLYHHIDQRYAFGGTLTEILITNKLDAMTVQAIDAIITTLPLSAQTKKDLISIISSHQYAIDDIHHKIRIGERALGKQTVDYLIHKQKNTMSLESILFFDPNESQLYLDQFYYCLENREYEETCKQMEYDLVSRSRGPILFRYLQPNPVGRSQLPVMLIPRLIGYPNRILMNMEHKQRLINRYKTN